MSILNLNTVVVNSAKESARASQRGIKKLHRKVNARQSRIDFLESFIADRQLTSELEALEARIREEKRAEYMAAGL